MGFSLFIQSWFPHIPFKMATWWSMKLLDHVFPHKLLKPQIQTIHNDLPTISKNGFNLQLEVCWVCLSHYTSTLISTTIKEHVAWNLHVIIPFWKNNNNHQQPHIVEFKWKAWHEAVPRPDDIGPMHLWYQLISPTNILVPMKSSKHIWLRWLLWFSVFGWP